MTIEEMKERKRSMGYSIQQIAELSGVPLGTVQKIFGGITRAPRRDTILALEKVLAPERGQNDDGRQSGTVSRSYTYGRPGTGASRVEETAWLYQATLPEGAPDKQQGEYTVEDYYALREEQRVELIDGVLYANASPTAPHQIIAFQVGYQMQKCMEEQEWCEGCEVITGPGVQLDMDDCTMVEPDLAVLCDLDRYIPHVIYGAPDFVLEVLSPSTRRRDLLIKLNKYWHAGVREYWIADPDEETVTVYAFEKDEMAVQYTFDDTVPVRISEGKCSVDFRKIQWRARRIVGR